jgi:hypothetical protein
VLVVTVVVFFLYTRSWIRMELVSLLLLVALLLIFYIFPYVSDVARITETEVRDALEHLEPMWEELFPAEQARLVQLLVERVTVGPTGADIKLRVEGLSSLVRDLRGSTAMREAA